MAALLLCASQFVSVAVSAQETPIATRDAEETDPDVLQVRDRLKNDPAMLDTVADRVARSQLVGQISDSTDPDQRLKAVKEWIARDPNSAAHVALGLAGDDAGGNHNYESALLKQMGTVYDANPGAGKNIFNRLKKSAKDSKLLKQQSDNMSDDEKREILRSLFEGQGAESNRVIHGADEGKNGGNSGPGASASPATSFNGIYDRLSAGNLRGYSPQLMALQSALNGRRPPGAPALVETGKLDYPTLAYPAYGMKYDVGNLDERLRRERLYDLAKLAGRNLTERDYRDPNLEAELLKSVPADKLPPRLKTRAELAAKARAALNAFLVAAEKAKNPNGITRGLLVELGGLQKESARWIAAAALEEELSRTDELEGFLTAELLALIDAAPAPAAERDAYKKRGEALKDRVAKVKSTAQTALDDLQSDAWASKLAQVDALVAQIRDLKNNLPRDIDDFRRTPYLVSQSVVVQPRWRQALDDLAVKWAPSLSYSREVARRRGRLGRVLTAFGLIASGDAGGAHQVLVNETGGR